MTRSELDDGSMVPTFATPEPEPEPELLAHDHDVAELRAVERVVAELVRGASRRTRRQILAILDPQEETQP